MARIGEIVQDFTLEDSDPLATMLALQQYPQAVQNLTHAFIQLANDYKSAGITIASGEPGASLVNLISDVSASQKKGKQP